MVGFASDALLLIRAAGEVACASGRPKDDCPYDPDRVGPAYDAWCEGWENVNNEKVLP